MSQQSAPTARVAQSPNASRAVVVSALLVFSLLTSASPALAAPTTTRNIDEVFVDTFFLSDVPPIRAKMPLNLADDTSGLVAGIRVDSIASVIAGGQYASFEELMAAFYANQAAFNADPSRDQIRMSGTVKETVQDDGSALIRINVTYHDLPLTLYTLDSWFSAFETLDMSALEIVLKDGTMNARLRVEMVIPHPGAPLHFWDAALEGRILSLQMVAHGTGWLVDSDGARIGRAVVHAKASPVQGAFDSIRVMPVGG